MFIKLQMLGTTETAIAKSSVTTFLQACMFFNSKRKPFLSSAKKLYTWVIENHFGLSAHICGLRN